MVSFPNSAPYFEYLPEKQTVELLESIAYALPAYQDDDAGDELQISFRWQIAEEGSLVDGLPLFIASEEKSSNRITLTIAPSFTY